MEVMDIYRPGCERRCWNGENATGERSRGGMGNHGAKGSAFAPLPAGQTATLLDARGTGVVDHIWLTFKSANRPLDPVLLRALRLDMFWDDSALPAVSVPLGGFFRRAAWRDRGVRDGTVHVPARGGFQLVCQNAVSDRCEDRARKHLRYRRHPSVLYR